MVLEGAETSLELAMNEALWHARLQGPHLISRPNELPNTIHAILQFVSGVSKGPMLKYLGPSDPVRARLNICDEFRKTFAAEIQRFVQASSELYSNLKWDNVENPDLEQIEPLQVSIREIRDSIDDPEGGQT